MILTVVVCTTANRPELKDCLDSLKEYKDTEVLIVNNSRKKFPLETDFRVIQEKKHGISHARNTGWKKAKGEYVAYIDDDSIADKNWIKNIKKFIKKRPKVEVFGGPYYRHSYKDIPKWMPNDFGTMTNGFVLKKLDKNSEWLSGTNMIFKKRLLKQLNGFSTKIGMRRDKISYGDETELQVRIKKLGIDIWYDPILRVSHLVDKRKMNIFWLIKDSFIRGRSVVQLKSLHAEMFKWKTKKNRKLKKHQNTTLTQNIVKTLQFISYGLGTAVERYLA